MHAHQCSQQHCLQFPRHRNNPSDHQQATGFRRGVDTILVIKRKEILPFAATQTDLENFTSAQYVRERQMLCITYINLKYKKIQMNLQATQEHTHRHRKTHGYQRGEGREEGKARSNGGTDRPLRTEQMSRKGSLYSTRGRTRCPVRTYDGK